MHPTSLNKMKAFVEEYLKGYENYSLTIIDLGSQAVAGMPTYKPFFNKLSWKYIGVDITPGENVDLVVKDPYNWVEIEDASVDVVISGQAFEHIEYPWLTMKEIFRILKDRGVACIIAPSSGPEHRHPVDCWRFFPDGMKALGKWAGLRVVEVFTDWGLDPWRDTFAVFQKPLTGSPKVAPFEEFGNKECALKVYIEAFRNNPQNPEYYARAVNILKTKGEAKKALVYLATALSIFPHNLWLRQRAVELYLGIKPELAFESILFLLRTRPITAENVRLIGKYLELADEDTRKLIFDQLPPDINQLRQFAMHAENQRVYLFAEECWRRISEANPNDINAKLMYALMPMGYGESALSKKRFETALNFQLSKNLVNRTTIIQLLINKFNYRTYLEIGVARGLNFFQIQAPLKIGVDPKFVISGKIQNTENERFYQMTSDEFFANPPEILIEKGIDLAFIDGLHTYEQSLRDVENCLKYLNPDGIIVMHDCLPSSEAEALPSLEKAMKHPEFKGAWTGDVYKTILHVRTFRPDLFVFVINTDHGVGIIKKGQPENLLSLSLEEIQNFTFQQLAENKVNLLNLKPPAWFSQWLNSL